MSDKCLYKFNWDCGRDGWIESVFVCTEEEIKEIIGKRINFGEVLGKHSEIYGTMEEHDVEKVELDQDVIEKVTSVLGDTWCGYNPFHYLSDEEE